MSSFIFFMYSPWFVYALVHNIYDSAFGVTRLLHRLHDDFQWQARNLDVSLERGDAFLGSSYFEVHITHIVFYTL
jgi:hypothetical protein